MTSPRPLHALPAIKVPEKPPTRFSTVREVAAALRVSRMTVYRLIADGKLPAYKVADHATRIPTAAVWEYLRGRRIDPFDLSKAKAL